jgi:hypothetical protein
MTFEPLDERNVVAVTAPRRGVFRLLAGVALGVVVLLSLAGCGGEEAENGGYDD